jgi:hypothetical protein
LGNGTINGSLTVSPGGIVSPGTSVGALSITNVVTLQGTTFMELNKAAATNDVIKSAASIQFGGTLSLTNLAGSLAITDSFKLFHATAYSGAFTNLTPAIPALNLGWNTSTLTSDGSLRIASLPTPQPRIGGFFFNGSSFVLSGSNGVAGWTYQLLTSTNLSQPLASWTIVSTNVFDAAGNFIVTNQPAADAPQRFYLLRLF